jgi:chromosome segregation ATPase
MENQDHRFNKKKRMGLEKEDIEEIGEAIERVGVALEKELQSLSIKLSEVKNSLQGLGSSEKALKEDLFELKKELLELREFLENFDQRFSGLESKLLKAQEKEEEEIDLKGELSRIRQEIEFMRSLLTLALEEDKRFPPE